MVEWTKQKESYLDSAEGYFMLGMYKDALAEIEKILAIESNEQKAQYLRGIVLIQLKKFDIAEAQFNNLILINPDNPDLYVHLAYILRRMRGLDAAIIAIKNALRLNPGMPIANYNLACYYSMKNDIENSLKYLKKAVELDTAYALAARDDEDFELIRSDSRFKELIRIEKSQENQEK